MNKKGLLVTALSTVLIVSGCGPTSNPTTNPSVDPTSTPSTSMPASHEGITLDYFILVNESRNTEINEAITYFSGLVENEYGMPFVLMNKEQNSERYSYEIIVGNL